MCVAAMLCPEKAAFHRTPPCPPARPSFLTMFPESWEGRGGDRDAPCEVEYSTITYSKHFEQSRECVPTFTITPQNRTRAFDKGWEQHKPMAIN